VIPAENRIAGASDESFVAAVSGTTTRVIAAAMLVGTAALMILGLQPLLLGALTEEHRLTVAALGRLATFENLALAAGSALGWRLMAGPRMREKATVACAALALANIGIYLTRTSAQLFLLRGIAGALEGLMLGAAIVILTSSIHPERTNALFLAIQTVPQMVAAYVLPAAIIPRWGSNAGFALLGRIALVSVAGAWLLKAPAQAKRATLAPDSPVTLSALTGLGAVIAQNAGIGGAWNYFEQEGAQQQFGPNVIGVAMSGSLAAQIAGAFFVAWIGWRAPYRIVLPVGIAVQAFIVVTVAHPTSPALYVLLAGGFGLLWLGLQPYQIRQMLTLDPSRRSAFLVIPLALTGLSIGPFAVSFAVRGNDVGGCFRVAAAFLVLSAALFAIADRRGRHR
jgi:MFS transporter, DHA1 family, inner membrane transport protein